MKKNIISCLDATNFGAHADGTNNGKRSKTFPGIAKAMAEQWG